MAKPKPTSAAKLRAEAAVRLHRLAADIDAGRVEIRDYISTDEAVEIRYMKVLTGVNA